MVTANFLISLWGMFLVFVPLSLLINPQRIKKLISAMENETTVFVCGTISFVLGTATVLLNNVWATKDWRTILTVIGWVMIIRGLVSIFMPEACIEMMQKIKDKEWTSYAVLGALLLGLVCIYFGLSV